MKFIGLVTLAWGIVGASACMSKEPVPGIPFIVYGFLITIGALVLAVES